jgi:hypothetical protein
VDFPEDEHEQRGNCRSPILRVISAGTDVSCFTCGVSAVKPPPRSLTHAFSQMRRVYEDNDGLISAASPEWVTHRTLQRADRSGTGLQTKHGVTIPSTAIATPTAT